MTIYYGVKEVETNVELYIDSGTHVDTNIQERITEIEDALGEPDVVFNEASSPEFRLDALLNTLEMFPYAPLVTIAVFVQFYVFTEFGGRIVSSLSGGSSGRDQEVVTALQNKYDIESRGVDTSLSSYIYEHKLISSVVNWTAATAVLLFAWPDSISPISVANILIGELLVGYVLFLTLLSLVHDDRNSHFARCIADSKEEYEKACLVTGEAHHAGTARFLEDEAGVTVLNPEPEDLSTISKISLKVMS